MPFYVIEFEEGGLAVVPSFWLTPRKKEVYWPPVKDSNVYKRLVMRQEAVDELTWKLYGIQKVYCETTDFETAETKLKKAELTSNLDTSDEDETGISSLGRKRKLRRFSSSCSSENENSQSQLKRPPALKCKKINKGKSPLVQQNEQTSSVSASRIIQNTLQINNQAISTSPKTSTPHQPMSSTPTIQIDAKAYQTLLQKVISIQQQNAQILALLEHKNTTETNASDIPDFPVPLPLQSQEDLQILEIFLGSNGKIVVSFLSRIGGENVVTKANRILKYMLTDKLAAQFSFFGKREKKEFGKLNLFGIIKDSVARGIECTNYEIEKVVKVWLKHAPQRIKKAQNRTI